MVLQQTVVWTALPNGIREDGGRKYLRIAVYISPRLQSDEAVPALKKLSQYKDWLAWHQKIATATFSLKLGAKTIDNADIRRIAEHDEQVWKAVFSEHTKVMPYKFEDFSAKRLHSYPVMNLHDFIRDRYQDIAVNPEAVEDFPEMRDLIKGLGELYISRPTAELPGSDVAYRSVKKVPSPRDFNPFSNYDSELVERYQKLMSKGAMPPGPAESALDFFRLSMFHRPHSAVEYDATEEQYLAKKVDVAVPKPDFHEAVSAIGDYPAMLPKFGLVVNLEVQLTADIPASSAMQVVPTWASTMPTVNFSPLTAYEISSANFRTRPRPANPETADGLLKLGGGGFDVIQLDVDGAGLKMLNLVYTLFRKASNSAPDTSPKEALSSLRSAGLSLVKTGRAYLTNQVFARMAAHNTALVNREKNTPGPKETTLYTEDVVRGYRIDIHDKVLGKWKSLCYRSGTYRFGAGGAVRFDNIVDEGFVQPGATEAADGSKPNDMWIQETLFKWDGWSLAVPRPAKAIVQTPPGAADPPKRMENTVATDFRIQVDYTPVEGTLPRLRFNREYRMRARVVDLAGNSVPLDSVPDASPHVSRAERYRRFEPVVYPVVILRALPIEGEAPERLVIRTPNAADGDVAPVPATSERHIAPPKTSQLTAEQHGMFDDKEIGAMKADAATYNLIKKLDGGKFKEVAIPVSNTEKTTSALEPAEELVLPYMPDPFALTAACSFYDLPGSDTNKPLHIPQISFGSIADWPKYKPFRIRLEEGKAAPAFSGGVLTVQLPKSFIATVRIRSSFTAIEHLETMGMWQWTEERGTPALQSLRTLSTSGRNSLITPYRTLTLIHAVQRPLLDPALEVKPGKEIGDTFATLDGKAAVHVKSTGHIDVYAEWHDPIDDVTKAEPDDKPGPKAEAFIFDMKFDLPPNPSAVAEPWSTAFIEPPSAGQEVLKEQKKRHEFRDTKYHEVTYFAIGTTRFKEFFPKDTTPLSRIGPGVKVDILNSARPDAPRVLYAVPTFGWKKVTDGSVAVSARSGNGLRVYLDRPWYSSGKGEQLGVVLRDTSAKEAFGNMKAFSGGMFGVGEPELVQQYQTCWGMDPIWLNKPLPADVPRSEHFPLAVGPRGGLTIDEMTTEYKVSVAPHDVAFDPARSLWYCDIVINPGDTYFPFVRLALARYQPKSVDNAHLSRVVRAEFVQLAPDRLATVSTHPSKPNVRIVAVAGFVHHGSLAGHVANEVEVSVERNTSASDDALAWKPVPAAAIRLDRIDATTPGVWTGEVALPGDNGRYRLVVREYELFLADDRDGVVYKASNTSYNQFKQERRLVYADVIDIG